MKKTKLTRSLLAACSIVALSAVMYGCVHDGGDDAPATDVSGTPDPAPDPAPMPVDVTAMVTLGEAEEDALLEMLPVSGTSDTLTIAAGGTATRNDVNFTCMSAYPCTVTVTNSLGTILAEVSTQKLPDADGPVVMASLPPEPVDTFEVLNDGSTAEIRTLVTAPTLQATELTGMDLGGKGAYDASKAALRSSFDPNTANATPADAAGPGLANALMGGSTLGDEPADAISGGDIASAPAGWEMKTLFRDWGDTAGTGDGGFETGAIVVKNIGSPTTHPWDAVLAGRFVNNFSLPGVTHAGNNPYNFTVRTDGVGIDDANPATAVAFTVDATADNPGGMGTHVNANVAGAGALGITVTSAEDGAFRVVSGQFLGVSGT